MQWANVTRINAGYTVIMAVIALLLGAAYYWLFRPSGSTVFLALLPAQAITLQPAFMLQWFGWLPTFLHVLAFSLLTCLVLGYRHVLFSCLLWGTVNALFEIGQSLPAALIYQLPDLFNLRSYLASGTFDLLDLMACVLGAWVAWILLVYRNSRTSYSSDSYERPKQIRNRGVAS